MDAYLKFFNEAFKDFFKSFHKLKIDEVGINISLIKNNKITPYVFNFFSYEGGTMLVIGLNEEGQDGLVYANEFNGEPLMSDYEDSLLVIREVKKEALSTGDKEALKESFVTIKDTNILYDYSLRGHYKPMIAPSEFINLAMITSFLMQHLFVNKDFLVGLNDNCCFNLAIDETDGNYDFMGTGENLLFNKSKYVRNRANLEMVEKFKSYEESNEDAFLTITYFDNYNDECLDPYVVLLYGNEGEMIKKSLLVDLELKERKAFILNFLNKCFLEYGKPKTLFINDNRYYCSFINTFKKAGIKLIYRRNDVEMVRNCNVYLGLYNNFVSINEDFENVLSENIDNYSTKPLEMLNEFSFELDNFFEAVNKEEIILDNESYDLDELYDEVLAFLKKEKAKNQFNFVN